MLVDDFLGLGFLHVYSQVVEGLRGKLHHLGGRRRKRRDEEEGGRRERRKREEEEEEEGERRRRSREEMEAEVRFGTLVLGTTLRPSLESTRLAPASDM